MIEELKEIQEAIESKVNEKARLEGKIETLTEQLKEDGYNSIASARKAIDKLKVKFDKIESTMKKKITKFKKDFGELLEDY